MAKPIKQIRSGRIQSSIFENDKKSKEGKDYKDYSANIVKTYKDGDKYPETTTFFEDDLADLIVVATETQRYIKLEARAKK